jgi:hypothetical protein
MFSVQRLLVGKDFDRNVREVGVGGASRAGAHSRVVLAVLVVLGGGSKDSRHTPRAIHSWRMTTLRPA